LLSYLLQAAGYSGEGEYNVLESGGKIVGKKNRETEAKIVRPGRDIIEDKAESLNKKLFKTIDQGVSQLTLDFKNVKSADLVGLSVIAAAYNTLSNAGAKMALKNIPREIDTLLNALGLSEHFAEKKQE
jgi:anti-anti-sigma factor